MYILAEKIAAKIQKNGETPIYMFLMWRGNCLCPKMSMEINSVIWKLFSLNLDNLNVQDKFILDVSGQSARFELGLVRYDVLGVGYANRWRGCTYGSHLRGRHASGRPVTNWSAI